MKEYWTIFTDCKSKDKALKIASRLLDLFDCKTDSVCAEPYSKGGYVVRFEIQTLDLSWQQSIFNSVLKAQKVGRSWIINGDIEHELDAWSNDPMVAGVVSLHLQSFAKG